MDEVAFVFDQAQFLGGQAPVVPARDDGVIGPSENLSHGFCIDNPDEEEVRLGVDPTAQLTLTDSGGTGARAEKVVSYGELV